MNREEPAGFALALPIADRARSAAFYREVLGIEAFGPLADDGLPEPLQFGLPGGAALVLVPAGGFGWVLAGRPVADGSASECLATWTVGAEPEVAEVVDRVEAAGGSVLAAPADRGWGHSAVFTDPDGHAWQVIVG